MNTTLLALVVIAGVVLGALWIAHLYVEARAAWMAWRRKIRSAFLVVPFLVVALWALGLLPMPWYVPAAAVAIVGVLTWRRFSTTASKVTRWSERTRRKSGVASSLDVLRHASTPAMRRTAAVVRPSLGDLSRRERRQIPTAAFATLLVRAGGLKVWASVEDVTLVFGGPRMGKSGWLAATIVDAPGACLVTSTRADLYDNTAHLRPGPTLVFNAVGLAGLESTLTFDPLTGCEDPTTAHARASDLLSTAGAAGGGEREYWNGQGRRVLTAFLHAAALGGLSMRDVLRWVADPVASQRQIASQLRRSRNPDFTLDATQFVTTNDRTRTSITSTIMPVLGWLTSPAAVAAARPGQWTVEELLESRSTVYLLGAQETQSEPLVAALVGHIAREARRIAALQPGGRLDPPLGLHLDEASRMAPDALVDWTADMGGRGGTIIALFQSRAQLLARWGRDTAATILNNAGAIMLFGGTTDRDDLEFWSTLGGERDEPVTTTDAHGRVKTASTRKVRVLQHAEIKKLQPRHAIVFRRSLAPVIGRARMVWQARDARDAVTSRWATFVTWWTDRLVTPAPPVTDDEQTLAQPIPLRRRRHGDDDDSGVA